MRLWRISPSPVTRHLSRVRWLGREHRSLYFGVLLMKTSFDLVADPRDGVQGKGASRRLRRSGKVPAILYGGNQEPRQLILDHQNLLTLLVNERFYSTILLLKINGESQAAILKDVQRHPA